MPVSTFRDTNLSLPHLCTMSFHSFKSHMEHQSAIDGNIYWQKRSREVSYSRRRHIYHHHIRTLKTPRSIPPTHPLSKPNYTTWCTTRAAMLFLRPAPAVSSGSRSNVLMPVSRSIWWARTKNPPRNLVTHFQKRKRAMTMTAARYSWKKAWAPPVGVPPIGCSHVSARLG